MPEQRTRATLPSGLRTWFIIHFAVDMIVGIPLILFPYRFLGLLGLTAVEDVTARLVGAALIAIGGVSLIARDGDRSSYRSLLNLKIIWAATAMLSFVISAFSGAPKVVWLFFAAFAVFFVVWVHYRRKI
ncbi:MAG: hypothetical protein ABIC95_03230 [archaeon]